MAYAWTIFFRSYFLWEPNIILVGYCYIVYFFRYLIEYIMKVLIASFISCISVYFDEWKLCSVFL